MPPKKIKPIPAPPPGVEPVKRGRKSKPWRNDPTIMARLSVVADMLIRRANTQQIAQATGASFVTAKRDIARVRLLWRESALNEIEDRRIESIEQYKTIQLRAWSEYINVEKGKSKNPRYLQIAMDAQNHIDDLEGTKKIPAPININLSPETSADDLSDDALAAIAAGNKPDSGRRGKNIASKA